MRLKVSRRLLLLGGLGIALAVVVMARRADNPAGTSQARSNGRSATTTAATQTSVAALKLELLKGDSSELESSTRNPFQFRSKPSVPAVRAQANATKPRVVIAPPPVPQGPPPPPPIALKYIGVLETAPEFVVVDNIELGQGAEGGPLSVTLHLSTYYRETASRDAEQ